MNVLNYHPATHAFSQFIRYLISTANRRPSTNSTAPSSSRAVNFSTALIPSDTLLASRKLNEYVYFILSVCLFGIRLDRRGESNNRWVMAILGFWSDSSANQFGKRWHCLIPLWVGLRRLARRTPPAARTAQLPRVHFFPSARLRAKKSLSKAAQRADSTPPMTWARWFKRGSDVIL